MKDTILTPQAVDFLSAIHRRFNPDRKELLRARTERQAAFSRGEKPDFLKKLESIRKDSSWKTASVPEDLKKRWVEITGPTDPKMMINALNSGADVFMADFEDSNAPTWKNILEGQGHLAEAVRKKLTYKSPEGKEYALRPQTATLMIRPRGLHLVEKHFSVDGEFISGAFFDFGLAFFHNAHVLMEQGSGPYFYLPKLESSREARLWNQLFFFAEEQLHIPPGTIRATVLIETITAAFEMEEILYELKEHICGLNAGRWDYIFSIIKKFSAHHELLFPDRSQITMEVPFMQAYCDLLVHTAHKRGAHAIGGMSAFIPSRKDPAINAAALQKVQEDKLRESSRGFDGTWVAHPDLVPVARQIFEAALQGKAEQKHRLLREVESASGALLQFAIPGGIITEAGFRQNISVALQYLAYWLSGTGAAALFNLMEDAATAEISRAQLWQWIHHSASFNDGTKITPSLYAKIAEEEKNKIRLPEKAQEKLKAAKELLDQLVLSDAFAEFLTLLAYEQL